MDYLQKQEFNLCFLKHFNPSGPLILCFFLQLECSWPFKLHNGFCLNFKFLVMHVLFFEDFVNCSPSKCTIFFIISLFFPLFLMVHFIDNILFTVLSCCWKNVGNRGLYSIQLLYSYHLSQQQSYFGCLINICKFLH